MPQISTQYQYPMPGMVIIRQFGCPMPNNGYLSNTQKVQALLNSSVRKTKVGSLMKDFIRKCYSAEISKKLSGFS